MEPARTIIKRLGGAPAVARRIGRSASVVYRWGYPKDRGGLGGNVPSDVRPALIEMAREIGQPLSHDDFYAEQPNG